MGGAGTWDDAHQIGLLDSFGMVCPTSKNIAEKPDAEKPDQGLEASPAGDRCVMPRVQAKRFLMVMIGPDSSTRPPPTATMQTFV
jgi:hypothetical protein